MADGSVPRSPGMDGQGLTIAFILGMLAGVLGYRQFVALSKLASPVRTQPPLTTGRGPSAGKLSRNVCCKVFTADPDRRYTRGRDHRKTNRCSRRVNVLAARSFTTLERCTNQKVETDSARHALAQYLLRYLNNDLTAAETERGAREIVEAIPNFVARPNEWIWRSKSHGRILSDDAGSRLSLLSETRTSQ